MRATLKVMNTVCQLPKIILLLNSFSNYERIYKSNRLSCWKSDEGLWLSEKKSPTVECEIICIGLQELRHERFTNLSLLLANLPSYCKSFVNCCTVFLACFLTLYTCSRSLLPFLNFFVILASLPFSIIAKWNQSPFFYITICETRSGKTGHLHAFCISRIIYQVKILNALTLYFSCGTYITVTPNIQVHIV